MGVEEYILWFDVAMDDVLGVEIAECCKHLLEEGPHDGLVEWSELQYFC